ncbi:unnamed protein product [Caenorhabditis sp. 36 PRJEB53466]|nr:unnamed protein product [Caenorhabditis sp. 36 PRJEB53466]
MSMQKEDEDMKKVRVRLVHAEMELELARDQLKAEMEKNLELSRKIEELSKRLTGKEDELARANAKIVETRVNYQKLEQRNIRRQEELKNAVESLCREKAAHQNTLNTFQNVLEDIEKEKKEYEKKYIALEKNFEEIVDTEKVKKEKLAEVDKLNETIKNLKSEINAVAAVGRRSVIRERLSYHLRIRITINFFNKKPEVGVQLMREWGIVNGPHSIANLLFDRDDFCKSQVGEYIGTLRSDFHIRILEHFLAKIDLKDLEIDMAFRKMLKYISLPREPEKVDKIVEKFAMHYANSNPEITLRFRGGWDTIHVISFSVVMLQTDLYNVNIKRRMTVEDYVRNLRGADKVNKDEENGINIDRSMLEGIYGRMKEREFEEGFDHVAEVKLIENSLVGENKPNLTDIPRRLVHFFRMKYVSNPKDLFAHKKCIFLLNDMIIIAKGVTHGTIQITGTTYVYEQHGFLLGAELVEFREKKLKFGIMITCADNKTIHLNAANEEERVAFMKNTREIILEATVMEAVRYELEMEKKMKGLDKTFDAIHTEKKIPSDESGSTDMNNSMNFFNETYNRLDSSWEAMESANKKAPIMTTEQEEYVPAKLTLELDKLHEAVRPFFNVKYTRGEAISMAVKIINRYKETTMEIERNPSEQWPATSEPPSVDECSQENRSSSAHDIPIDSNDIVPTPTPSWESSPAQFVERIATRSPPIEQFSVKSVAEHQDVKLGISILNSEASICLKEPKVKPLEPLAELIIEPIEELPRLAFPFGLPMLLFGCEYSLVAAPFSVYGYGIGSGYQQPPTRGSTPTQQLNLFDQLLRHVPYPVFTPMLFASPMAFLNTQKKKRDQENKK